MKVFSFLFFLTGGDQPFGERHRNDGANQRENQQHCPAARLGPESSSTSSLYAPERDRGPSSHGGIYQLRKGGLRI